MYRFEYWNSNRVEYFTTEWDLFEFGIREWGDKLAGYAYFHENSRIPNEKLLIVDECIVGRVYVYNPFIVSNRVVVKIDPVADPELYFYFGGKSGIVKEIRDENTILVEICGTELWFSSKDLERII